MPCNPPMPEAIDQGDCCMVAIKVNIDYKSKLSDMNDIENEGGNMVLVFDNESSNFTSSSNSHHIRYLI